MYCLIETNFYVEVIFGKNIWRKLAWDQEEIWSSFQQCCKISQFDYSKLSLLMWPYFLWWPKLKLLYSFLRFTSPSLPDSFSYLLPLGPCSIGFLYLQILLSENLGYIWSTLYLRKRNKFTNLESFALSFVRFLNESETHLLIFKLIVQ